MDTGGGQIVCRTPRLDFSFANEHFAAASERLLEDGRGFTAGNGGGRQKFSFSGGPPWRKGRNTQRRVPLRPSSDPSICADIWDTYHTTSHSNGLIYGYTYEVSSRFTRIYILCCCLLKWYG